MRFGRKNAAADAESAAADAAVDPAEIAVGPFDISEVEGTADFNPDNYIDLGSVMLPPMDGAEVRMQVDETTGDVQAVLMMTEDAALEVRAFAAPRAGDLWSDIRREIAADTAQRGGTADQVDGPFGPELACQLPVQMEDGQTGVQPSRVIGINGQRWVLRVALLGQPAIDAAAAPVWEDVIRGTVVRRGAEAMPAGEPLPFTLPTHAQRMG